MSQLDLDFKNTEIIQGVLPEEFSYFPLDIQEKDINLLIAFSSDGETKLADTTLCNRFIAPWIEFSSTNEAKDFIEIMYRYFVENGARGPLQLLVAFQENSEFNYAIVIKESERENMSS